MNVLKFYGMPWLLLMAALVVDRGIQGKPSDGDSIKFIDTDDLIQKFAQQNPDAAADYEEVRAQLMGEYEEARKRRDEKFRQQKAQNEKERENDEVKEGDFVDLEDDHFDSKTIPAKRTLAKMPKMTFPDPSEELLDSMAFDEDDDDDNIYESQPKPKRKSSKDGTSQQRRPRQRRETEQEMEARIRRKIEKETLQRRETVAKKPWNAQESSKETASTSSSVCLPAPLNSICGLNILFSSFWVIGGFFVFLAIQKNKKRRMQASSQPKKKKSKQSNARAALAASAESDDENLVASSDDSSDAAVRKKRN